MTKTYNAAHTSRNDDVSLKTSTRRGNAGPKIPQMSAPTKAVYSRASDLRLLETSLGLVAIIG